MGDRTSEKKRSKKRSKLRDEPVTLDEQPKRKKAKKAKKRHRETKEDDRGAESDGCEIVNLPEESGPSGDEENEVLLVRDEPDETETKETEDERHGSIAKRSEESESDESEEDMGGSSESELEIEPEDAPEPKFAYYSKRKLHHRLTRDIEQAEMEENEDVLRQKIKELQIAIDWEPSPLHLMKNTLTYVRKAEKEELKKEGIKVKTGAWTQEEDNILAENWMRFSKEYDIRNPLPLLGLKKDFRLAKHQGIDFAMYLGQGLGDRPLLHIYQRARRLLDPNHFQGRFSDNEWKQLRMLVVKHGKKWSLISKSMDRSDDAVRDYYKAHGKDYNRGRWKAAEDRRLLSAMKHLLKKKNLMEEHHHLPWTEVEDLVKTRNASQCSARWIYILSWTICGKFSRKVWKTEDDIRLIKTLRDSSYQNASDIPWHSMYEQFGLLNCMQLKSRWDCMRLRVPRYFIRPFNEIMDWLVENRLPQLKQRVKNRKRKEKRQAKVIKESE